MGRGVLKGHIWVHVVILNYYGLYCHIQHVLIGVTFFQTYSVNSPSLRPHPSVCNIVVHTCLEVFSHFTSIFTCMFKGVLHACIQVLYMDIYMCLYVY